MQLHPSSCRCFYMGYPDSTSAIGTGGVTPDAWSATANSYKDTRAMLLGGARAVMIISSLRRLIARVRASGFRIANAALMFLSSLSKASPDVTGFSHLSRPFKAPYRIISFFGSPAPTNTDLRASDSNFGRQGIFNGRLIVTIDFRRFHRVDQCAERQRRRIR